MGEAIPGQNRCTMCFPWAVFMLSLQLLGDGGLAASSAYLASRIVKMSQQGDDLSPDERHARPRPLWTPASEKTTKVSVSASLSPVIYWLADMPPIDLQAKHTKTKATKTAQSQSCLPGNCFGWRRFSPDIDSQMTQMPSLE